MSEQPIDDGTSAPDDANSAGATSEQFGNLSVEDNPEGTTDPAELAETESPSED
jgi:hypothetical protein